MENNMNRQGGIEELSLDQIDAVAGGEGDGFWVTVYNDVKHAVQGLVDGLFGREQTGPDSSKEASSD